MKRLSVFWTSLPSWSMDLLPGRSGCWKQCGWECMFIMVHNSSRCIYVVYYKSFIISHSVNVGVCSFALNGACWLTSYYLRHLTSLEIHSSFGIVFGRQVAFVNPWVCFLQNGTGVGLLLPVPRNKQSVGQSAGPCRGNLVSFNFPITEKSVLWPPLVEKKIWCCGPWK